MESSSNHMVSLLKIESPTSGWVKPLKALLNTIDDVNFKIDKRSKTVYIYGKTKPEIILEKIAKAGQKAEIVWSNHESKKPLDNQRGYPMQQCNNYYQQYNGFPPPPPPNWMYQQPIPYQGNALLPPYALQLNPPPPLPVPGGSQKKELVAKKFPPTPPPPKNFTMGDQHLGCGIM